MQQNPRVIPWYRQLWPWLVMLPPAVAVIGGIATVYVAFRHADPEVCGHYVRDAFAARDDAESLATRRAGCGQ
jgi:hypothetical protein